MDADGPLAVCAFAGADATRPVLAEVVGEFLALTGIAVVAAGSQDVVAVLSRRQPEQDPVDLAERLVATLVERFPGHRPVVGLGGVVNGSADLREPLVCSRKVCRTLRPRGPGPAVQSFAGLGTHRLLLGMQDIDTLRI